MKPSVTNCIQLFIVALSAALLVAAAHAHSLPAEDWPDVAEVAPSALDAVGAPRNVRVCVAAVHAQMNTPAPPASGDYGTPLRGLLMSRLIGIVEVMPLAETAASDAQAEAQAKECDFALYTTVTREARGDRSIVLRGASQVSQVIPLVGPRNGTGVTATGVTAGTVLSGAGEAARVVKARDQVSLECRLVAVPTGQTILTNFLNSRAHEDGQDLITPLIEQEAAAVLNLIRRQAPAR